ncbi:MAG TPA: hypothetical protein DEH02_08650 [Bacteroidales bacterium]|nr:MAG: hypothetical protein A2X01_03380 [Bacteroidetes bacterium GWF2_35_48]HBX51119.1 hypothetical protein [Bacteroidales bacterium]
MAKQWLYSLLLKDSLLAASSPVFEVFTDSISGSNTGTIYVINQTLSDTTGFIDSVAVANANTNMVPQNIIETNYKTVINIYQSMLSQGINNFTQSQIETLESIATLCPYTDGNAVYSARTILSLISSEVYMNECEKPKVMANSEKSIADTHNQIENINTNLSENEVLEIYPNPASDVLYINYSFSNESYLEIYNVLGSKLVSIRLNSGTSKKVLSLKNLSTGIYYLKIIKDNKVFKSEKIVIMN